MSHQLYRHFDADGKLLYVGISLSSAARLAKHRICSAWFRQIALIRVEQFADEPSARVAERKAIAEENPVFNKQRRDPNQPRLIQVPVALMAYLDEAKLSQEDFARLIGVSQGAVWQWLDGRARIAPERAVQIERKTAGKVRREDLRPDVFDGPVTWR